MKYLGLFLGIALALSAGCVKTDEGDTSPLPPSTTQAKVESAKSGIEGSSMSAEQKRAAEEYMQRGAAGAEAMRKQSASQRDSPR